MEVMELPPSRKRSTKLRSRRRTASPEPACAEAQGPPSGSRDGKDVQPEAEAPPAQSGDRTSAGLTALDVGAAVATEAVKLALGATTLGTALGNIVDLPRRHMEIPHQTVLPIAGSTWKPLADNGAFVGSVETVRDSPASASGKAAYPVPDATCEAEDDCGVTAFRRGGVLARRGRRPNRSDTLAGILRCAEDLHVTFREFYHLLVSSTRIDAPGNAIHRRELRRMTLKSAGSLSRLGQAVELLYDVCFPTEDDCFRHGNADFERLLNQLLDFQSSSNACFIVLSGRHAVLRVGRSKLQTSATPTEEQATQTEKRRSWKKVLKALIESLLHSPAKSGSSSPDLMSPQMEPSTQTGETEGLSGLLRQFLASLHRLLDVVEELQSDPNMQLPPMLTDRTAAIRNSLKELYPSIPDFAGLGRSVPSALESRSAPPSAPTASAFGSLFRLNRVM
ncbi:hypothetical protein DFJ74DRAFT_465686 [Hyaloraphidium curvatum]|nr:hypothetical protein DFJ74DRAFT_465686 [Hyaloraphidium curvatum]